MSNFDHDMIIFSEEEEEMDVGESGELGDEGNPGQGIVGVREAPKNTGKIEMEGVAGNGKVGSPSHSNSPTKSPPNVHPPKQGKTSEQALKAFLVAPYNSAWFDKFGDSLIARMRVFELLGCVQFV